MRFEMKLMSCVHAQDTQAPCKGPPIDPQGVIHKERTQFESNFLTPPSPLYAHVRFSCTLRMLISILPPPPPPFQGIVQIIESFQGNSGICPY